MGFWEFITSATSPWWAAGVFVVVGAFVSTGLSASAVRRRDRTRDKRLDEVASQDAARAWKAQMANESATFLAAADAYLRLFVTLRVRAVEEYPDWQEVREAGSGKRFSQIRLLWAELYRETYEPMRTMAEVETRVFLMGSPEVGEGAQEVRRLCAELDPWQTNHDFKEACSSVQVLLLAFRSTVASVLAAYPEQVEEDGWDYHRRVLQKLARLEDQGKDPSEILAEVELERHQAEIADVVSQMYEYLGRTFEPDRTTSFLLTFSPNGLDIVALSGQIAPFGVQGDDANPSILLANLADQGDVPSGQ